MPYFIESLTFERVFYTLSWAGILISSIWALIQKILIRKNAAFTTALVSDMKRQWYRFIPFAWVAVFTYTVDGRKYKVPKGAPFKFYDKGQKLKIMYNKNSPRHMEVAGSFFPILRTTLFILLSARFLLSNLGII